jgi:hypothetical protein
MPQPRLPEEGEQQHGLSEMGHLPAPDEGSWPPTLATKTGTSQGWGTRHSQENAAICEPAIMELSEEYALMLPET